jgi:hypothetical protein
VNYVFDEKPALEDIEHYGVAGMKWGVRKERRARNKELNKASRKKDAEEHAKTVQAARDKIESGKAHTQYRKAKSQYAQNKRELGSREARKILAKERAKFDKTWNTSQQFKTGKEAAVAMLAVGGVTALAAIGSSVLANR